MPYLILLLLSPTVGIAALRVRFHGHGGEEILHGIITQVVTNCPKTEQEPVKEGDVKTCAYNDNHKQRSQSERVHIMSPVQSQANISNQNDFTNYIFIQF